jgi:hypothetical protein
MYAEYYIVGCATANFFFDKEHILILRRYQLHSASATTQCPSSNTNAHSKKKSYKKSLATVVNSL